jgi:hypothetical protein
MWVCERAALPREPSNAAASGNQRDWVNGASFYFAGGQ